MKRKACRGLLVTPEREILLLKIENPEGKWIGWITPGGGLNPGEDELSGLARELREELGFTLDRPAERVWTRSNSFPWDGKILEQEETFFLIRTERFEPVLQTDMNEFETAAFRDIRWWKLSDVKDSNEVFAPRNLAGELEKLLDGSD